MKTAILYVILFFFIIAVGIFLINPMLALGLYVMFLDPNNYRTNEIQSYLKESLEEKYGEEFIVYETEYSFELGGFLNEVYPENKRYLHFDAYVPSSANDIYTDYQIKKRVDTYIIDYFKRDEFYYEIRTGRNNLSITDEVKNESASAQVTVSTIEDIVNMKETFKKMDEVISELRNKGINDFELTLLVVKKPYTIKKLGNELFQNSSNGFIYDSKNANKIALLCQYEEGEHKQPFSKTCKKGAQE